MRSRKFESVLIQTETFSRSKARFFLGSDIFEI